jgi:hypothetical protein
MRFGLDEKLVQQRLRRFVEVESGRIGYALTAAVLSGVSGGATWIRTLHSALPTPFLRIQNLSPC